MIKALLVITLVLSLAACGSTPKRAPAPVEDQNAAAESKASEVKTFGYVDNTGGVIEQQSAPAKAVDVAPTSAEPATERQEVAQAAPPAQASSGTVLALLQTAEGQESAGNLAGAAATLERALRIQPRNAVLWNKLAEVRYKQGQYSRAASLANKSNGLAGGDTGVRNNNELLISKAKRAQGEGAGDAGGQSQGN